MTSLFDGAPRQNPETYTLQLDAGGAIVTGYRVYRATTPNVAATDANRVGQLTSAQLAFVDTNVPEGAVYYVVTALYATGESASSNEVQPGATNPDEPVVSTLPSRTES